MLLSYQQVAEKHDPFITPAEAGVQERPKRLDSRLRGNDSKYGENYFFNSLVIYKNAIVLFFLQG
jgi:hypothetical protein